MVNKSSSALLNEKQITKKSAFRDQLNCHIALTWKITQQFFSEPRNTNQFCLANAWAKLFYCEGFNRHSSNFDSRGGEGCLWPTFYITVSLGWWWYECSQQKLFSLIFLSCLPTIALFKYTTDVTMGSRVRLIELNDCWRLTCIQLVMSSAWRPFT